MSSDAINPARPPATSRWRALGGWMRRRVGALLVFAALSAIRVVQQYERGVIFVLGRLIGAKGPGLFLVPPFISRMRMMP